MMRTFSGTTAYLTGTDAGLPKSGTAFSVLLTVNTSLTGGAFLTWGVQAGGEVLLIWLDASGVVQLINGSNNVLFSTVVNTGTNKTIEIDYDGSGNFSVFVDGTPDASNPQTMDMSGLTSSGTVYVGSQFGGGSPFDGQLGNVGIWGSNLAGTASPSLAASALSFWPLATATDYSDSSGNGNVLSPPKTYAPGNPHNAGVHGSFQEIA